MATELYTHPTPGQLRAFAQGRLSGAEMAEVERHVAQCDSCCGHLEQVPDDTLVQLAREAATQGVRTPAEHGRHHAPRAAGRHAERDDYQAPGEIPKELRDHPRYRVLSLVGHGGMGAVYKAEHRKMERLVALKVINQNLLANPQAVERFGREVRAVSKLSHPNIVLVHDADEAGDLHFLVMEFVDGVSLDRVVAHNGPLPLDHAAKFIKQAAEGLQHAHEKGMVHRDIKPQNLMLTRKKHDIKILDFGLARLAGEQPGDRAGQGSGSEKPGQTVAGMVLGTPDYIAPEQATDARSADIRADIYSLGCTLYYLLTAQPPFPTGSTIEKLNLHLKAAPTSILEKRPDVPAELARILDKMLAKNPGERYQTPDEVAKDLASLEASGRRKPPGNPNSPAIGVAPASAPSPAPSSDYPVLSTCPLDDASLALAASPLRPVTQAEPTAKLPFGLTPPAAIAIGIGSVLLLGLLAWGINAAINGSGQREPLAQQQPANPGGSAPAAPPSPLNSSIPTPSNGAGNSDRSTTPPSGAAAPSIGAIANNLPRKVLLVVPSSGLHLPDYANLRMAFEEKLGIEMDVASKTRDPVQTLSGESGPAPDRLVDASLQSEDYGAIVFAGLSTEEYHPASEAGNDIARLLKEFERDNKVIASICAGQRVLARHGYLDGKRAAYCRYLEPDDVVPTWDYSRMVVEHQNIITASADKDAANLAQRIAGQLGQ